MTQSGNVTTIYNSRQNILNILERQGYNIDDYSNFSIHEVHIMLQNKQLDMMLTRKDDEKKIYVKYHLGKTLRPNTIIEYVEDLFELEKVLTKNDDLMIIMKDEPNDTTTKLLKNIWETDGQYINVMNIKRLQFNILEHSYVPPHRIISEDEETSIRERYNIIKDKQIPEISRFDPVALAIGIRPGQLCEIIRPSKTAITSKFYRICSQ